METLHPQEIKLGLDRIREVQKRLRAEQLPFPIVTVAGTNGKGSTVAMLESILHAAGYKVAAYTSPHLLDYNERVRIARLPVDDARLCAAFARVDHARHATPLTYFEFGTLAAIEVFRDARVDLAVLEVGLGGRLDAVNAWDADVAVITAIGIDHTEWLGPDRESIGREKAGVMRAGRAAVCSDPAPPASIAQAAQAIGARLYQLPRDFACERQGASWNWRSGESLRAGLPYPALRGDYQLDNAAGVLMALALLADRFPVTQAQVRAGLLDAALPGRFQTLPGTPARVLDVAHNPQAAQALAATLRQQRVPGRTLAVVGMLKDKPLREVLAVLAPGVDAWFLGSLPQTPRGASAEQLRAALPPSATASVHADVASAYRAALVQARSQDRIVVFGSFYTVGAILRSLQHDAGGGDSPP